MHTSVQRKMSESQISPQNQQGVMLSKSQKSPTMRWANSSEQDIFKIHFNWRKGDLMRQKVQKLADRL